MMHRIKFKRTAVALLAPWLVIAVAVGAVAAAPSSAVASSGAHSSGKAVRLVSITHDDTGGPITAASPSYQIPENSTLSEGSGTLTNGATDTDSSATCCTAAADPANPASDGTATVNTDGSFSYVPDNGFTGTDSFGFILSDTDANSASGTVTVDVLDPAKTDTQFTNTGTPPAAAPGTNVSFAVNVSASGGGPTPTGTVTFTWTKTNGVPNTFTGTIGTSPVDASGNASVSGVLPVGGQGGDMTITATYSGDAFNKSSYADAVYYVIKGCYTGAFPANTNGQTVPLASTSPEGYYIGQSNGWFTLYVVNPSGTRTKFTGSVVSDGPLIHNGLIKFEKGDKLTAKVGKTFSEDHFLIVDHGFVTGFSWYAACGQYVSFTLDISGAPAKKKQIFLGTNDVNPATANVDITRKQS
jgi:Bacterial Ig domain